ncbi:calcium/sodium antiporter [Fibrobacter sp.]|uniref:calcium/sodium antiporter n=1 Tax=Fibrobacter sp. TaxID=35828 RepID=UPI001B1E70BC|nr:calcium/sodium antiporter [Fibrobacter sp.]MBO7062158.1 calcium/sodium antiporter [Fibrobacter sp.]MBR3669572.1 calcium/sodium antiporter [Fibrobacter sp.]
MLLPIVAVVLGLAVLVWSADKFVDGAVGVARFFGMSTLLIGMVIVGFGTSAPEMVVSALSAMENAPELALGNAYGSNIANIALILGVTALISPVIVKRDALKRDLPILIGVTAVAIIQAADGSISRLDGIVLLLLFAGIMGFNIWSELRAKKKASALEKEAEDGDESGKASLPKSVAWLLLGLTLLVLSSRCLVWGAVEIAQALGVSDLLIGLTIVAVGTSLPELASSIAAARKGENDLAFGNIVGSNLFNTLTVVGIASTISPMRTVNPLVFSRDLPVVAVLTVLLLLFGLPVRKKRLDANGLRIGRINRLEGSTFLAIYVGYIGFLIAQAM